MTNHPILMRSGDCSLVLDPKHGGRVTSFAIGGRELLVQSGRDVFHSGSFVMAPWAGRLRNGVLKFEGTEYAFPINDPPHAMHGLVTASEWQVDSNGELSIELTEPWPWRGRVSQTVQLSNDKLEFVIRVDAQERMPVEVGWHPWFKRHLVGSDASLSQSIEILALPELQYANDSTGLPTGKLVPPEPRPWDFCFINLASPPSVRWPGTLELKIESSCTHWVIYEEEPAGVCVEPWTGPPNSLNMPNPHIVLPGEPLIATMTWTWRELD
jgi:aldose 1-epimerase